MKCMFCSSEIDENRSFDLDLVTEKTMRAHAAELGKWRQITATISNNGGQLSIFTGHVCPLERIEPGDVAVIKKGE